MSSSLSAFALSLSLILEFPLISRGNVARNVHADRFGDSGHEGDIDNSKDIIDNKNNNNANTITNNNNNERK